MVPATSKSHPERKAAGQGIARLQQAAGAAVSALLQILVDPKTQVSTKLRAADLVLEHGAKAIEIEDIEARVSELERAAESYEGNRRFGVRRGVKPGNGSTRHLRAIQRRSR